MPALLLAVAAGVDGRGGAARRSSALPIAGPSPTTVAVGAARRWLRRRRAAPRSRRGRPLAAVRRERVDGDRAFVKVFGRDSRDADLLYRGYRAPRAPRAQRRAGLHLSLKLDVEHEAFLLLLARTRRSGVSRRSRRSRRFPTARWCSRSSTSTAGRLDEPRRPRRSTTGSSTRRGVRSKAARSPHRAPCPPCRQRARELRRAGRHRPRVRRGVGHAADAGDRPGRAPHLAGHGRRAGASVASAARVIDPEALAAAAPFIQPLALSSATTWQQCRRPLAEGAPRRRCRGHAGEEPAPRRAARAGPATHARS